MGPEIHWRRGHLGWPPDIAQAQGRAAHAIVPRALVGGGLLLTFLLARLGARVVQRRNQENGRAKERYKRKGLAGGGSRVHGIANSVGG
jgi:hypothetical protein